MDFEIPNIGLPPDREAQLRERLDLKQSLDRSRTPRRPVPILDQRAAIAELNE